MLSPDERDKPAQMDWNKNLTPQDAIRFGLPTQSGGIQVDNRGGFTGQIIMWPSIVVPDGWLACNGQAVYEYNYPDLFNLLCPIVGTYTCVSATDVFTCVAHGLVNGDLIALEAEVAVPDPMGASPATYGYPAQVYVRDVTTDTFKISFSRGGAAVNITNTGTGVQWLRRIPFGMVFNDSYKSGGDYQFYVPNFTGAFPSGYGYTGSYPGHLVMGGTGGEAQHTLTVAEMPAHTHNINSQGSSSTGNNSRLLRANSAAGSNTTDVPASQGGGAAHDILPPFLALSFLIKV